MAQLASAVSAHAQNTPNRAPSHGHRRPSSVIGIDANDSARSMASGLRFSYPTVNGRTGPGSPPAGQGKAHHDAAADRASSRVNAAALRWEVGPGVDGISFTVHPWVVLSRQIAHLRTILASG
jgi:hypothetical protein